VNDLPVYIRELQDGDKAFVACTWMDSLRYSAPAFCLFSPAVIKKAYIKTINRLFDKRPNLFRVLVNEEDGDQIFAWVCGDTSCTHFVYVKEDFRQEGFATLLIDVKRKSESWTFTHWTRDCERIGDIEYKPSLFRSLIHELDQAEESSSTAVNQRAGDGDSTVADGGRRQADPGAP
jgi:hypothetical protein